MYDRYVMCDTDVMNVMHVVNVMYDLIGCMNSNDINQILVWMSSYHKVLTNIVLINVQN